MSKQDFSAAEFADRRQRVRVQMRSEGLDVLIVVHPVCLHWLTGTDAKSYQSFQCLFVDADDETPFVLVTRESERAEYLDDALIDVIRTFGAPDPSDPIDVFAATLDEFGYKRRRIGLEVPAYYLHPHEYLRIRDVLGESLVAEPTNLVHSLKLVKSPAELSYIREAARIADVAMQKCIDSTRAGVSELDVSADIYQALLANGSGVPASPINFVSGERLCFSHGAPTRRQLHAGDGINAEFGASSHRYTATIGRQLSIGNPTARMREVYEVCRAACDACIAAIADGIGAHEPHHAAKEVIEQAGFERHRVHLTGYGIAPGSPPSWGEPLKLNSNSTDVLRAGMVVSVEPPIYIHEERIGARIIDNVLVTASGCEILSTLTRDLIVV